MTLTQKIEAKTAAAIRTQAQIEALFAKVARA